MNQQPLVYGGPFQDRYRALPAEWNHDLKAWVQDGQVLPKLKSSYAFVWPKDGKRTSRSSTWGRFKDILKNEGPDIYVTKNAHKLDYLENRPRVGRWGGWGDLGDDNGPLAFNSRKYAPWVQKSMLGGRMPGLSYDFRTRKYGLRNINTWSNAEWLANSEKYRYPDQVRRPDGSWWQGVWP